MAIQINAASTGRKLAIQSTIGLFVLIALALNLILPRLPAVPPPSPFLFTDIKQLTNGSIQVTYTGPLVQYRLYASTNVTAWPVQSTWTLLTNTTMTASLAMFTDNQATNYSRRFYVITSP